MMISRALGLLLCAASALPARAEEGPPAPATARAPRLSLLQAQALGAVAGLGLGLALGERPDAPVPALRPLRTSDAILTGSAGALVLGGKLLYHRPADMAAAEDEPNAFDRKIRRLAVGRRSLENRLFLDHVSSGTLMAALFEPVGLLLAAEVPHRWSRDVPVVVEASAITLSVNAFVKHLTRRSRPAAHFCESERTIVPCPPDTRLSFYSGHTSSAFAAAVAAGTIADFHHLENRKWIWASGLTFATTTGVLRVMSDQHYASDVLTGMAAGGLAGWLIPKLHRPDRAASPSAAARSRSSATTPVYLSIQWRW
jgi:membrane-associated phospholipid phosphatase